MTFATWLRHEFDGLFNFFLPPACAICLTPLNQPDPDTVCPSCRVRIEPLQSPYCPRCALPYPAETGPDHYCQMCLQEKRPTFVNVTVIGPYDGLLKETIHRFKYRNDINLDRPLALLLAEEVRKRGEAFDLVLPVPLHKDKFRQRSYNQSALLARRIARSIDSGYAFDLLIRPRPGTPQKEMSAQERKANIRNAFAVKRALQGERILLIDDVMTTGATARECAATLRAAGAASVHVAVLARAPLR